LFLEKKIDNLKGIRKEIMI